LLLLLLLPVQQQGSVLTVLVLLRPAEAPWW
jgi:hypothetical protein